MLLKHCGNRQLSITLFSGELNLILLHFFGRGYLKDSIEKNLVLNRNKSLARRTECFYLKEMLLVTLGCLLGCVFIAYRRGVQPAASDVKFLCPAERLAYVARDMKFGGLRWQSYHLHHGKTDLCNKIGLHT